MGNQYTLIEDGAHNASQTRVTIKRDGGGLACWRFSGRSQPQFQLRSPTGDSKT